MKYINHSRLSGVAVKTVHTSHLIKLQADDLMIFSFKSSVTIFLRT
jgi:hypothetical protein